MPRIHVLSPHIANQIAAGEVVERPASVVKELIENALDAGATDIVVEIENGGTDLIRVSDNGHGIPHEDCRTAFLRHATSKIATSEDLSHILTLGFRGEALASIAAVSEVLLRTRTDAEEQGTLLRVEAGQVREEAACACARGTTVEVRNLFANVPARLKFLKSVRTESGYVSDYVSRMIMAVPGVSFHLTNNGKTVYRSFGDGQLKNAILCVYGSSILPNLRLVAFDDGYLAISGFIGTEALSRPNRLQQSFFLNGRYIRSFSLSAALQRAFDTKLMSGRFPFAVLCMRIAGGEVDVNVHPTKLEVRFVDEQRVVRSVTAACHRALLDEVTGGQADRCTNEANADARAEPARTMAPADTPARRLPPVPELRRPMRAAALPIRESYGADTYSSRSFRTAMPTVDARMNGTAKQPEVTRAKSASAQLLLPDEPFTVVGVAFLTYWLVQQGENLFLIDQHAAHERRLYEMFMRRQLQSVAQPLLAPQPTVMSPLELETLELNREALEELGFAFDFRSDGVLLLTSVPQVLGEPLTERFLHDALEQLSAVGRTSAAELRRERIIQSACKHAVKAGEPITEEEISALLLDFAREGIPMTCPHGRPVMIRLTKREIEKLFKRVL